MTLSYELCKELKEAGFSQNPTPLFVDRNWVRTEITLSELIDACGDGIDEIFRIYQKGERLWRAQCGVSEEPKFSGQGKTLEEAVARLWLKLNSNEA